MKMEDPNKKYKIMENVLININKNAIALSKGEKKRNNKILIKFTETIIPLMRQKDPLFGGMYERNFYGGSYYDNLKVGNPNEYDLDLILKLPVLIEPYVNSSNLPAFVMVHIKDYAKILQTSETDRKKFEKINSLLDTDNYLSTTAVLNWMERVINLALNDMPKEGANTYIDVENLRIYVKLFKGAPAFTMRLFGNDIDGSDILLDIDLVPCFQFIGENHWPKQGYRSNPVPEKPSFLVVPKKPKDERVEKSLVIERYWRLSFQEQERELIGQNLRNLKPSLRLLKKLRDKYNHKIASYFIKTVFLWTLEEEEESFWSQSLSVVFMSMLKKYGDLVRNHGIPYYWNKRYNLIGYLKDATKTDIANKLQNIIRDVERNLTEPLMGPYIVGKHLLSLQEFEKLKEDVPLGKKIERKISIASSISALNDSTSSSVDCTDSTLDDSPPIVKVLKFEPSVVDTYKQYSNSFEEKQKRSVQDVMAQINNTSNGISNNNDILTYLKKIDEKMDKILEKFNEAQEDFRETNSRLTHLEEQVGLLQLENRSLRSSINNNRNDIDNSSTIAAALLDVRLPEDPNLKQ